MATNRDLLKEAIADAKTVKATAIANAKAALEEAFTPHLTQMLSAKLQEMEMDEDYDSNVDDAEADVNSTIDEVSLDELLAELESDDDLKEAKGEEEENEESEEMSIEDMGEDDLKSFIEDVIKDMVAAGELEAGHEGMENEEGTEEHEAGETETEEAAEEAEGDEEEEINLDELLNEEEDLEEVTLDELLAELEGEDGGLDEKVNLFKQKLDKRGVDPKAFMIWMMKGINSSLDYSNWDIDKMIKNEIEFEEGESGDEFDSTFMEEVLDIHIPMFKEESNEELEEAMATIAVLRKDLNEINLLNAKLLYTNKIFRNKSLTESQKVKVLTAFDKATSKKEVELVYETLNEGLKVSTISTKSPIKESLGSASRALGSAVTKPIIENDAFARMRELAGLKK
jgi:hypothetical protein